jgi:Flp pilus assembly protein TadG
VSADVGNRLRRSFGKPMTVRAFEQCPVQATRRHPRAAIRRAMGERGASLVEFALVVPLLLMIVFGAFSGAVAFNNKQDIVYAAREGARYGATVPQSQCTPIANCGGKTWAQLVQAVVVQRSDGEIKASEVCAALVSGSPGTVASAPYTTKADGTSCYNDANGGTGPRVQVSVSHPGSLNAVFLVIPLTTSSQATAHFEQ